MDIFEPTYSFKDLYTYTDVTKNRVNQWRLRKLLPAEVESRGSGNPAKFCMLDLVIVRFLDKFQKGGVSLQVASEILINIKKILRKEKNRFLDEIPAVDFVADVGSNEILAVVIDGEVLFDKSEESTVKLIFNIGEDLAEVIELNPILQIL